MRKKSPEKQKNEFQDKKRHFQDNFSSPVVFSNCIICTAMRIYRNLVKTGMFMRCPRVLYLTMLAGQRYAYLRGKRV